jgi:hypothetical protein
LSRVWSEERMLRSFVASMGWMRDGPSVPHDQTIAHYDLSTVELKT